DELMRQPDADSVLRLPQLQNLRIQESLVVRDVMTHRIHSVPPDTTVRRTLDLMLRRKVHAVPVVGEKGEVLGMVTDSDIMRVLLPKIPRAGNEGVADEDEPRDRPVREIMTRSVLCVAEDLGVSEVASMMINKDVEQLPVVNAGSITGMVYRGDIIRKLFGRS
ncbi:MAG: HPP family protein, partial [Gemmatimonadota bacterium]